MSQQQSVPGPGEIERGRRTGWSQVHYLGILSLPDDGVVRGTSGRARLNAAEIVYEGSGPRGMAALIEGLDGRGALTPPPRPMRTPCTLLYAEDVRRETVALWGLDLSHARWLEETFPMRPPGSLAPWGIVLPGGRVQVTPEVAYAATDEGRAEWERIRAGFRSATGGRRGGAPDPDDPFGGYDYAAPDED